MLKSRFCKNNKKDKGGGWQPEGPGPLGPGPMGLGPWARAHGPMGPWAHGPWPMAHGPWPMSPGPWAQGPKLEKYKMPNSTFDEKNQLRTFRMARIDPSRQGVMNEASFVLGDISFWPKNDEKGQKRQKSNSTPIHCLFFF